MAKISIQSRQAYTGGSGSGGYVKEAALLKDKAATGEGVTVTDAGKTISKGDKPLRKALRSAQVHVVVVGGMLVSRSVVSDIDTRNTEYRAIPAGLLADYDPADLTGLWASATDAAVYVPAHGPVCYVGPMRAAGLRDLSKALSAKGVKVQRVDTAPDWGALLAPKASK